MVRVLQQSQQQIWLLLVILPPLVVNFWGQRPFTLPKVAVMRTLVWLLAALVVTRLLRRLHPPRRWPLAGPLALLALVLVVTTATAVDWRLSLWGSYHRSQGLLTQLTYLLLCLLAAAHFHRHARARQVTAVMAIAAVPLIVLGLLQAAGWQPLALVSDARSSIFATLGRANFLGAYLAILLPLTLAHLLVARSRRSQVGWALLLAGQVIVLLLTQTRSAWLAAAVALVVFALLAWDRQLSARRQLIAWIGAFALGVGGPLAVVLWGAQAGGSTAARLGIWQGTLDLIRQRPLLGYGVDSLEIIFPGVYPSSLVYAQGRDFFVDRAHNVILDWTVAAGLPGLLALALVLLLFAAAVGKALRRPLPRRKRLLLAAAAAAVAGNLVNNLLSFDTTATATIFWLLLGLGMAQAAPPAARMPVVGTPAPWWRWGLVGLLFAGLGLGVWAVNGRPLAADVFARAAQLHGQQGRWEQAAFAAARAAAMWPWEPAHHLLLSDVYRQQALAANGAPEHLAQAEAALRRAQLLRPGDVNVWLHTAHFYAAAAYLPESPAAVQAALAQADVAFRQALALAPSQATVYTAWGRVKVAAGEMETAASLLRRAVQLDASSGAAYLYLGAAELALGQTEAARGAYGEAVRLQPQAAAYAGLAQAYWELGRPQAARGAVAQALALDPHHETALALAALLPPAAP